MLLFASIAFAVRIGPNDVATAFFVSKSDDRNRVDYGVRATPACAPIGAAPVFAYWRRFEPGQPLLGDLNALDARAYGIAQQQVRVREAGGSWIELSLNALPAQRILVLIRPAGRGCVASARSSIAGREAHLDRVFVQLGGPLRIEHVMVYGRDVATGEALTERRAPR